MNNFIKLPLILAVVTFLASGLIVFSEHATRGKIIEQKKLMLLNSLKDLIPDKLHDNDIIKDAEPLYKPELLGHRKQRTLYMGKLNGIITVLAIPVTARNGYSGDIDLMVGVSKDGITAVKILEQHETPGLGDLIESNKSDWLQQFPKQNFSTIAQKDWKVQRDGGKFDQITGATITPRAVVLATKQALNFYDQYINQLKKESEQ